MTMTMKTRTMNLAKKPIKCKIALAEWEKNISGDTPAGTETKSWPRHGDDGVNEDYKLPEDPPVVKKLIEIINGLCRKYKYAVLKDHDIIHDNELEFYVDYQFNGKHLGVVTIALDKSTAGVWMSRVYLSVHKVQRLPMSNLAGFISDFKRLIKNLHILVPVQEHL